MSMQWGLLELAVQAIIWALGFDRDTNLGNYALAIAGLCRVVSGHPLPLDIYMSLAVIRSAGSLAVIRFHSSAVIRLSCSAVIRLS